MNLKSCVTKSKHHYTPHKLRSHPLRCITFPVCVLFLFIIFWFIICPLIYVALLNEDNGWPKEWPYYYWIVALIIFVILLSILVCLWRCVKKEDTSKPESDSLLNSSPLKSKDSKQKDFYMISLNTIQKSQDKLDVAPLENVEKQKNCAMNVPDLEKKLTGEVPVNENKTEDGPDTVFRRCSIVPKLEKVKARPESLAIPTARETKAEVHSASSPLTPRELFFWDLIQNANQSRNSTVHDFIEHERQDCLPDNGSLNSTKPIADDLQIRAPRQETLSSSEYFIANVPDRKSLTTEIFLFVDGGPQEKQLQIRTCEDSDDVFKD